MVFEQIEKLKREYTDKFVVVDDSRPELRRFHGMTGTVKTVNMSGRALVEFDALNNIGWYDIDLDFLKVVDAPVPKEPPKKVAAAKPARSAQAPSPLEKAREASVEKKTAAEKTAAGGKMSMEQMLAAARASAGGATAPAEKTPAAGKAATASPEKKVEKKADPGKMSVADMLAAARGEKAGGADAATPKKAAEPAASAEPTSSAPVKRDPSQMSLADMLAAARGEKSGGTSAAPSAPPRPAKSEAAKAEAAKSEAEDTTTPAEAAPAAAEEGEIPTDIDGILAWCRKHDG